jgi:hypothetical protein
MSAGLIAFVGFIYLSISVEQFIDKNIANTIIFLGYAFSNVGLYLATKG